MRDGAMTSARIERLPALYALAFFVVAIALATLAPFEFKWMAARSFPVWRITLADIAQNLLLFAPIGIILAQGRSGSLLHAAMFGFLLSATVEFAQLSIVGRSSNFVDIITNTSGAIAGWAFGMVLRRIGIVNPAGLVYSLMVLPLCWVIAMRSFRSPELGWLVIPAGIAAVAAFKTAIKPHLLRTPLLLVWLVMALLPLVYVSRDDIVLQASGLGLTSGFISFAVVAGLVLPAPDHWLGARLQASLLVFVLAVFAAVDVAWFLSQGQAIQWRASTHLHWAVVVICLSLLLYFSVWLFKRRARNSLPMAQNA